MEPQGGGRGSSQTVLVHAKREPGPQAPPLGLKSSVGMTKTSRPRALGREHSAKNVERRAKGQRRKAAGRHRLGGPPNSRLAVLEFPKKDPREKVLD